MTYQLAHLDALESEAITSSGRSSRSSSGRLCSSPAARTRRCCSTFAVKACWPQNIAFPSCTSTPGTTSPRSSSSATGASPSSACASCLLGAGGDRRRRGLEDPTPGPPVTASRPTASEGHHPAPLRRVFGGGRRDEEKPGEGAHLLLPGRLRSVGSAWPASELWNLYNGRHRPGEHFRVFPLSNWTSSTFGSTSSARTRPAVDLLQPHPRGLPPRGIAPRARAVHAPFATREALPRDGSATAPSDMTCTAAVESDATRPRR